MRAPLHSNKDADPGHTRLAGNTMPEQTIVDHREATLVRRKLAEMMSDSPRVAQQRALNESLRGIAQTASQRKEVPNRTGLPDRLKAGVESLSGLSLDHVRVRYNSDEPAQVDAHAYAQGANIHVAPGQEPHLAHEAWHVVQQMQGRVTPTLREGGVSINDDDALEREADHMGARALALPPYHDETAVSDASGMADPSALLQRKSIKLEGENLTDPMKARFATAYDQFNSTILATSPLAAQDNNQVVVWGVSQAGSKIRDYGSTTIYLGNNAYQGDDYKNFTELWDVKLNNQIDPQTAVRIVIAINLTINRSIEELYATLLHEWFVHAVNWEGALNYIRQGEGRFALAWIQGQGHVRRAEGEHAAFAQSSDEEIARQADALGLTGSQRDNTVKKMKADRDRH